MNDEDEPTLDYAKKKIFHAMETAFFDAMETAFFDAMETAFFYAIDTALFDAMETAFFENLGMIEDKLITPIPRPNLKAAPHCNS